MTLLAAARRVEIIDSELSPVTSPPTYFIYGAQKEDIEDLEGVHRSRRVWISAATQEKETEGEKEVEIPKEWQHIEEPFKDDLAYELPEHRPNDHAIDLEAGAKPPYGPIYSLSESELKVLRAYIEKHLANGFIRPSKLPAGAPIIFVKKKDLTIKNRCPLPLIGESLDRLRSKEGTSGRRRFELDTAILSIKSSLSA